MAEKKMDFLKSDSSNVFCHRPRPRRPADVLLAKYGQVYITEPLLLGSTYMVEVFASSHHERIVAYAPDAQLAKNRALSEFVRVATDGS
jgi:hypothetical protein